MEESITHTYHVGGMSCGGCVSTVKNKLSAVSGVTSVKIDLEKKEAKITSSHLMKADMLQHAFNDTNYTISELRD